MTGVHEYLKTMIVVPLVLLFNITSIVSPPMNENTVSALLQYKIFATITENDTTMFVLTMGNLYFLFIFNLLFGTYIFRDINEHGIYIFSRLRDRQKWWRTKAIRLFGFALLHTFVVIALLTAISDHSSLSGIDGDTVFVALRLLYLFTLISATGSLLINIIAIKWGSVIAVLFVYFIQALLIFSELLQNNPNILLRVWRWVNPMGGVFSIYETSGVVIFQFIYLAGLFLLLVYMGGRYVSKLDIGVADAEAA